MKFLGIVAFFFFAKKSCFRSREVSLALTRCLIQRSLWAGCERMQHVSVCVESPTLRASSLRCPPFGSRLAFGVYGVGLGSEGMEERGTYYRSECFSALPFVFWNALSFLAFRASCLFKDECKNRSSLYMKPSLLFSLPQEPWWYVCWDCHGHASWLGPALQNHEGSFLTLPVASVSLFVLALTFRKHLENHPKITGFWWSLDSRQWMPSFPDLEAKPPYCQLDGLSFYASYAIIWSTNGHLAEDGWGDAVSNRIIPGGPEVRAQCFHCQGPSPSLVGELRPLKLRGTAPLPHAHRPQIPEIKQGKLPFWSVKTFVSESDGGWWTWKKVYHLASPQEVFVAGAFN